MKHKANKPLLAELVTVEVGSAILAWCDLGRRSDDQIRGKKNLWRAFVLLNPGNSLAYCAFGRC